MAHPNALTAEVINGVLTRGKSGRGVLGILGVLGVMSALVLFVVSSTVLAEGTAAKNFAVNNGEEVSYKLITVQEGDSLWQLVSQAFPDSESHILIEQTLKYNDLKSTYLTAGQEIYIPCAQ
ncbi:MAG: LysM peptidoglycan-binding domain-containing protein [Peptococcaceae bacterium]|nr:LysM peptidoglycan-binding domain-containing protein [Peptococcaceae bacterium]